MVELQDAVVYVVRRGHGRYEVHPSPVRVAPGGKLVVKNLLPPKGGATARVSFRPHKEHDEGPVPTNPASADVAPGQSYTFEIVSTLRAPLFLEYQIHLSTGEWVVGGSSPGMIVDG